MRQIFVGATLSDSEMKELIAQVGRRTERIKLLHRYYQLTGFYKFIGVCMKKALPAIIGMIALVFVIHFFVFDIKAALVHVTENYPPVSVFSLFFASESLLGLIPPEIFIAWAGNSASPILFLSMLALLSYTGGIVSYFIGKGVVRLPALKRQIEGKMAIHVENTRKWGGFLIVVGALLPIPFSITSVAAGMIDYGFKHFLLFGLLRFLRFYIYAVAIFNLI